MIRSLLVAATAVVLAGNAARAECSYPRFDFFPEKGGGVVVDSTAVAGTPCTHNFGEGPGYHFTSVGIDRPPEHGRLVKQGKARFVYKPARGYAGKDFYMFKICATKGAQSGCSTIAFVASVSSR